MKLIPVNNSGTRWIALLCINDADGAAADADSTPTIDVWGDGAPMSGFATISVGPVATGVYIADLVTTGLVAAAPGVLGVVWHGWWTYTLDGITSVVPIEAFRLVPEANLGTVVADAGNTASTFEVAVAGGTLLDTTDDAAECLIAFTSGALAGQVRKVTAYNVGTGFITVDTAFTAAPSSGDAFKLINE